MSKDFFLKKLSLIYIYLPYLIFIFGWIAHTVALEISRSIEHFSIKVPSLEKTINQNIILM